MTVYAFELRTYAFAVLPLRDKDGIHAAPTLTVDLSAYPDLIVVMGIKTLLGFGPKIASSAAAQPEGLLLHQYGGHP
jgi:hypothetical protein